MVLPRKLSAKEKRWKVFFVVEGKREAKRALATDTRTCTTRCFNGVAWCGVVISRRDGVHTRERSDSQLLRFLSFWSRERERNREKERERERAQERGREKQQAMTNIMIIRASRVLSVRVLLRFLRLPFSRHPRRARNRVSTPLTLPPAPPEARATAAMFRRRGRGLPVARGNQRYPDIDLGATRRVARLLSGRENVITALWWLR